MRKGFETNSGIEKILQCYMHMNGRASCTRCNLSKECKKFKKFLKDNSWYGSPDTHTARMMKFDTGSR